MFRAILILCINTDNESLDMVDCIDNNSYFKTALNTNFQCLYVQSRYLGI